MTGRIVMRYSATKVYIFVFPGILGFWYDTVEQSFSYTLVRNLPLYYIFH